MAVACPTCGGVTSKAGATCTRCKRRSPEAVARASRPDILEQGPSLDLDRPAPPPLHPEQGPSFAPATRPDVPTGVSEILAPPPVTLVGADAVSLLAGFGSSPKGLVDAVPYALRVYRRLGDLRAEREVARATKPHEVPLYDAALVAYDEGAVTRGLAVLGSSVVVGILLVVLPLVLRAT